MMQEKVRSMKELWNDYLFLSKELHKFLEAEDLSLFEDLMQQRQVLMEIIGKTDDSDNFIKKDECQTMIAEIMGLDKELKFKMLAIRSKLKRQFDLNKAYDSYVNDSILLGNRFDSK